MLKILILLRNKVVWMVVLSGCVSVHEGRQMQEDLFNTQKRILTLENRLRNESNQVQEEGQQQRKKMASTHTRLIEIEDRISRLDGELGVVRMGVITGELPNQGNATDSIAKSLARYEARLEQIEQRQLEILEILKKKNEKKESTKRKKIQSVSGLSKAFKQKRYAHVVEDFALVQKKLPEQELLQHAEISYLYAESLYKIGDLRKAALEFRQHLEKYKTSPHVAEVTLRLGDSFRLLGDAKAAKVFYQEVIHKYAKTEASEKAESKLKELF
ncbi:MAG: tetratricopeptide repeat protein [Zetaproteobacteria bacterium]|nr:tetratricopeptide repeat protein [Zetaproteobacteria bacterium]